MNNPIRPSCLSKEQADEFRRGMSLISDVAVRHDYKKYWKQCELKPDYLPRPGMIQRLLNIWKVLWRHEELSRAIGRSQSPPQGISDHEYETPE
jgi:hypothetical protein